MKKALLISALSCGLFTDLNAKMKCDMEAVNRGSQQAINICAAIDFNKADRILNDTYKKLTEKHKNNKAFIKNLKLSQRAWIKFRDAEAKMILTYTGGWENGGTMYSMLHSGEMLVLTKQRTEVLKEYIKNGFIDDEDFMNK